MIILGNAFGQAWLISYLTGIFARRQIRGFGIRTSRWLGAPNFRRGWYQNVLVMINYVYEAHCRPENDCIATSICDSEYLPWCLKGGQICTQRGVRTVSKRQGKSSHRLRTPSLFASVLWMRFVVYHSSLPLWTSTGYMLPALLEAAVVGRGSSMSSSQGMRRYA
jgi:hypothetical protein